MGEDWRLLSPRPQYLRPCPWFILSFSSIDIKNPLKSFTLFSSHFIQPSINFWKDHNVIPTIAPTIEHIKIRVENFRLYLLIIKIYAETMSYKFLS